jgi:undecaprenyl-diphosphatase
VTHLWAIVLGLVQGFAEFLPVSSTAHLKLVPWLFQVRDPMLSSAAFDIALHAGSLVAVIAALWRDWVDLFLAALGRPTSKNAPQAEYAAHDPLSHTDFARKFLGFLLLTSIPAAVIGKLFESKIEFLSTPDVAGAVASGLDARTFHFAPLLLGIMLMSFGVLLWAADRFVKRQDPLEAMTWWKALIIGLAQACALIPGVSRSGSTMTAGRLLGLNREDVARYSFMAATPIIAGAAILGLKDVAPSTLLSLDWVLGFLAAAVSSVFVMRWMLGYLKQHSFAIFMWYRLAFGALVILVFFIRG